MQGACLGALVVLQHMEVHKRLGIEQEHALAVRRRRALTYITTRTQVHIEVQLL